MDFNSLSSGSAFYVLRKTGDKPVLAVGTVVSKSVPRSSYDPSNPAAFNGMNQMVVDITANLDGRNELFRGVPATAVVDRAGDNVFTGSREEIMKAVDNMMRESRLELDRRPYYEAALVEGEKMMEQLNPSYAEKKEQSRTIQALQERQDATDKKLDEIAGMLRSALGRKE